MSSPTDRSAGAPPAHLQVVVSALLRAATCAMFALAWFRVSRQVEEQPTRWGSHPFAGPFGVLEATDAVAVLVLGGYGVVVCGCALFWTLYGRNLPLGMMVSAIIGSIATSYFLIHWVP